MPYITGGEGGAVQGWRALLAGHGTRAAGGNLAPCLEGKERILTTIEAPSAHALVQVSSVGYPGHPLSSGGNWRVCLLK